VSRFVYTVILLLVFVSPLYAYNDYVILTYAQDGKSVDVDYGGLMNIPDMDIDNITLEKCTRQPDERNRCGEDEVSRIDIPRTNNSYVIDVPGLHKLTLIDVVCWGGGCYPHAVWEQFIVLFDSVEDDLRESIVDNAPVYAFHEKIFEHFPVSIELLYGRGINDFKLSPGNRILYQDVVNGEVVTHEFMKTNGHVRNKLYMNKAKAIEEKGDVDDFPTYWHAEKIDDNNYWVSYISLFAYDRKYAEYLVRKNPIVAYFGSHEVDRESISVRFEKYDNGWLPAEVVYAGHLEWQETSFRGCKSIIDGCEAGVTLAEWDGGKTRVKYPNFARIDRQPIVYVAHGSHAQFPAYGYYGVKVSPGITNVLDVLEPAGNSDQLFESGKVVELDMRKTEHQALTFSGFLLPSPIFLVPGARVNPFIRYPIASWTEDAGFEFNDCVEKMLNCQLFIDQIDSPPVVTPPGVFEPGL